jgi:hypothetical protein
MTRGKLAEIEGEDGIITLTSTVAADDTANMGGDNTNIQSRAETAQEFIPMQDVTPALGNHTWGL